MGRQIIKSTDWAYIAGFLDGDGSIMAQIKKRSDSHLGIRLMFTICFYQDSRHKEPLRWIKKQIGIGYLSDRNDKITELRINGYRQVSEILKNIMPYVKFKKKQAIIVIEILELISDKKITQLDKNIRLRIAKLICDLREENYFSGNRKYSSKEIKEILGF